MRAVEAVFGHNVKRTTHSHYRDDIARRCPAAMALEREAADIKSLADDEGAALRGLLAQTPPPKCRGGSNVKLM